MLSGFAPVMLGLHPLEPNRMTERVQIAPWDARLREQWNALWPRRKALHRHLPVIGEYLVRKAVLRRYESTFGRPARVDPPVTFNEHITHRLLYDRDPRLKIINDKLAVRQFIRDRVGAEYVMPTLGVWRRAEDIRWDRLPETFVLKPNHSCGLHAFVTGPQDRDAGRLINEARHWLRHDYFDNSFEWGYRGLPRAVIAEPLLQSPDGGTPFEAQVFTFSGRAALIRMLFGRKWVPGRRDAFFDATGRRVAAATHLVPRVYTLTDALRQNLIDISERLSEGFSSLRVDCYVIGTTITVGELTAYSYSGLGKWNPPELDEMLGRLWRTAPDASFLPDFDHKAANLDHSVAGAPS
jgi:hypothetical protein